LTQEELGVAAGYGKGAGVSISRVESGLTRPGPDRLVGIASALGVTSEELRERATALSAQPSPNEPHREASLGGSATSRRPPSFRSTKERLGRVQRVLEERMNQVQVEGEAFNTAHDRARDEFFLPFVSVAGQIEGAPAPPAPAALAADDDDQSATVTVAKVQLDLATHSVAKALMGGLGGATVGAAAGGAAAYAAFTSAVMFGTASTGAPIAGLAGVARSNAALAKLGGGAIAAGGAGIAGGTLVLTGIVAAPAALLAIGGLIWMTRRNRAQEAALREKLDKVEADIESSQSGYDALVDLLPRATTSLDYIATHAGHAVGRWKASLPTEPIVWSQLTGPQQKRHDDFTSIAGCQVALATLPFEAIMTTQGAEQDDLIVWVNEVLGQAAATVEATV